MLLKVLLSTQVLSQLFGIIHFQDKGAKSLYPKFQHDIFLDNHNTKADPVTALTICM